MRYSIFMLDTHTYINNMLWTSPNAPSTIWFSESGEDANALEFPESTAVRFMNEIMKATGRPALLHLKL